ncbi:MAG TPA: FliM/FliN family flagellar motor switch protein [Phycisphaeraceae bacterium]
MPADVSTILKLRVPLIVQIGRRRMKLEDVLALGPGAIVELNKHADEELDLLVSNKPVGKGTAVKVGENFGIRITHIGTARQRIDAMGSQPS